MGVMASSLLLDEATRDDARGLAPEAVVLFPIGATEQHGPHLPTGTDSFAVEHLARAAAQAVSDRIPIVVAPTLPFGSSHHHLPFGGTMSLGTETFYRVVLDLAESLIVGGFRRIMILNSHGGNNELIQCVARDLALKHPAHLAAVSYWAPAWDALVDREAHRHGRVPGHAGAFETSLMLALRPELVREPRPHRDGAIGSDPRRSWPPVRIELHGAWQQIDGYSDSPDRGSAERGRAYLEAIVESIGQSLIEFYTATGGVVRQGDRA
jgi:creatinine amidohydrolase